MAADHPAPFSQDPEPQPAGEALVAADGTWLCWAESGYGSPDIASPEVRAVLAAAGELLDALAP